MHVRDFMISFLIISITVLGGTCMFGFCANADSDIKNINISENDIPVDDSIIKEDGKLNGQVLMIKKPKINFGEDFDLANNQQKVIKLEQKNKLKRQDVATDISQKETLRKHTEKISVEMNSVLAEIKKQEQEVRDLLLELKELKEKDANSNRNKVDYSIADSNEVKEKFEKESKIQAESLDHSKDISNDTIKGNSPSSVVVQKKDNTSISQKKKFTPMIVENSQLNDNSYTSAFKDYSMDNSGRSKDSITENKISSSESFEKAFSALKPEKQLKQSNVLSDRRKKSDSLENISKESVKKFHNAYVDVDNIKKDFYKTYITENKYLKPFEADDGDLEKNKKSDKKGYDILQLKIEFQENSASLSAVDINILRYFVYIAQNDPTKGVQISISQDNMKDINKKKLAARRLAIVSAIFKEEGLTDSQIIPVLTDRDTESFTFSIISIDKIEKFQKNEGKDMFGDNIGSSQTFRTMSW